MIGGVVIETIVLRDRVWVNCEEKQSTSKCAIYVERNEKSERIKPADSLWWQGGSAMWTPFENIRRAIGPGALKALKCGKDYDIRLPRIGASGVKRPILCRSCHTRVPHDATSCESCGATDVET